MTIVCEQCQKKYTYEIVTRKKSHRRFCEKCSHARRYSKIKMSNDWHKKLRRNKKEVDINKSDNNLFESFFAYDEPNILGY